MGFSLPSPQSHWLRPRWTPIDAAVVAANEIGTDTDTIGTMAGALLGACDAATEPPERPLDSDYLLREADRLVAIAQGGPGCQPFVPRHPDLDRPSGPSGRTRAGRRPLGRGRPSVR